METPNQQHYSQEDEQKAFYEWLNIYATKEEVEQYLSTLRGLTDLDKEILLQMEQDQQVFPTLDDAIEEDYEPDWEWLSDIARGR